MGRSYWFECMRCGYRANVSGSSDRGLNLFVQTIECLDCKALYDAVTKLRFWEYASKVSLGQPNRARSLKPLARLQSARQPPTFAAALNRLIYPGARRFEWVRFALQCPVSPRHRVRSWNEPGRCPRCGVYLEKSVLPYRIWD